MHATRSENKVGLRKKLRSLCCALMNPIQMLLGASTELLDNMHRNATCELLHSSVSYSQHVDAMPERNMKKRNRFSCARSSTFQLAIHNFEWLAPAVDAVKHHMIVFYKITFEHEHSDAQRYATNRVVALSYTTMSMW